MAEEEVGQRKKRREGRQSFPKGWKPEGPGPEWVEEETGEGN